MLLMILLGLALGVRHAAEADHIAAVSTIVSREQSLSRAAWVGAFWGMGHTATILIFGGSILLFRIVVPQSLEQLLELLVAGMLIVLGVRNLRAGPGAGEVRSEMRGRRGRSQGGALAVGFLHGLAGSAAAALLVLALTQNRAWGLLYLLFFGAGTVIGMVLVTAAIAVPIQLGARRWGGAGVERTARVASGGLSVALGAMLLVQIGFANGFFVRALQGWR